MDVEKFAAFIQQRRKELGMKQSDLAEKIHVTDKAVSRWERAVGFPDIRLLEPLAQALEVSLTELLQCRRMEMPETEALAEETETILQKQKKLSWQRRVILWLGYGVILAAAWVLIYVSHKAQLPESLQGMLYLIAAAGTFFSSHALRFVVERLYLKSSPWGIWENAYKGIAALMMALSMILCRFAVKSSGIWSVVGAAASVALLIGAYVCYGKEKEKGGSD